MLPTRHDSHHFMGWESHKFQPLMSDILSYYAPEIHATNPCHYTRPNATVEKCIKYNYDGKNLTSKIDELLSLYEKPHPVNCSEDLNNISNHFQNWSQDPRVTVCVKKTACEQNLLNRHKECPCGFLETTTSKREVNTKIDDKTQKTRCFMPPSKNEHERKIYPENNFLQEYLKNRQKKCKADAENHNFTQSLTRNFEKLVACEELIRKSKERFYREYRRFSRRKPTEEGLPRCSKRKTNVKQKKVSRENLMRSCGQQTLLTESLDQLVSECNPKATELRPKFSECTVCGSRVKNEPHGKLKVDARKKTVYHDTVLCKDQSFDHRGSNTSNIDDKAVVFSDPEPKDCQMKRDVKSEVSSSLLPSPEQNPCNTKTSPCPQPKNATWETISSRTDTNFSGSSKYQDGKKHSKRGDSTPTEFSKSTAVNGNCTQRKHSKSPLKTRDSRAQLLKSNLEKIHKGIEILPQPLSCHRTRRMYKHPLLDRKPKGRKNCKRKASKRNVEKRRKNVHVQRGLEDKTKIHLQRNFLGNKSDIQFQKGCFGNKSTINLQRYLRTKSNIQLRRGYLRSKSNIELQRCLGNKSNIQLPRGLEKAPDCQILKSQDRRITIHANTLVVSCAKDQYVQVLEKVSKINVKKVVINCESKGDT